MQNVDSEALRQRVDERVRRNKRVVKGVFFVVNLLMFILFVVISVVMVRSADIPPELLGARNSPVLGPMIMLGMGWLTSLIFQGLALLMDLGVMDSSIRAREIGHELSRQLYEQGLTNEKAKRDEGETIDDAGISDDGELIALDDEEQRRSARR